jgi:flagellar brake protein
MTDNDTQAESASFTISRRVQVIEKLRQMKQLSVLINVTPAANPQNGFVTTIAEILPEKNIFAIDVSADAGLNHVLESSGELLFSATVDGVPARFKAARLISATLDSAPVFAVDIPATLYWQQKRRSYRMSIPPSIRMLCSLRLPDSSILELQVLNVSQTGFGVLDAHLLVTRTLKAGHVFRDCRFLGSTGPDDTFTAELRRTGETGTSGKPPNPEIGLRFVETTRGFDKEIQDFLHELAREKKRKSELTRDSATTGRFGRK